MTKKNALSALCVLLVLLVGVAFGGLVEESFGPLDQAPGVYRPLLTGDDPLDVSTPVDAQETKGNPNVACTVTFSVASASVQLELNYYNSSTGDWHGTGLVTTVVASATINDGGRFVAEVIVSSSKGARFYDWRVRSISSGNVSLRGWSYGAQSTAAQ